MSDFNPYQPPQAALNPQHQGGLWRDGDILVVHKDAVFPGACVRCGAFAQDTIKQNPFWHEPMIYLVLLISPLIYIIVAMIVRKTQKLRVPLCDAHLSSRKNKILIAWSLAILTIFGCIGAMVIEQWGLAIVCLLVFLGALILDIAVRPVLKPKKIDKTHGWYKGVSSAFLRDLPDLPLQ